MMETSLRSDTVTGIIAHTILSLKELIVVASYSVPGWRTGFKHENDLGIVDLFHGAACLLSPKVAH